MTETNIIVNLSEGRKVGYFLGKQKENKKDSGHNIHTNDAKLLYNCSDDSELDEAKVFCWENHSEFVFKNTLET